MLIKILILSSFSSLNLFAFKYYPAPLAIIEDDDRKEFYSITDPHFSDQLSATIALVAKTHLIRNIDNYQVADEPLTYGKYANLCSDTKFINQLSIASCSGFFSANNKMITAGHCLPTKSSCEQYLAVFDYKMLAPGVNPLKFSKDQVFELDCQKLKSDEELDYAIVPLKREVKERVPLIVSSQLKIAEGSEVVMLGSPHGIPFKFVGNAKVTSPSGFADSNYFETYIDVFGGNSGSPVLNKKTGEVEGILVVGFGEWDEVIDPITKNNCRKPAVRTLEDSVPAWVLRGHLFEDFI